MLLVGWWRSSELTSNRRGNRSEICSAAPRTALPAELGLRSAESCKEGSEPCPEDVSGAGGRAVPGPAAPPKPWRWWRWTQPRSSPSRSALSCCFHSECQPFAVQPKLFSSWGLAPPRTDAARASPKRSPRWESLESDFLVGFVHHRDQSGDPLRVEEMYSGIIPAPILCAGQRVTSRVQNHENPSVASNFDVSESKDSKFGTAACLSPGCPALTGVAYGSP